MQLEAFSKKPKKKRNNVVDQLLPFVKPFAFSWFNLQAQKRKYQKQYESSMPFAEVKATKEELKATSLSEKKVWAERLLTKLVKDVKAESSDDFIRCITTKSSNTPCVPSQSDCQGKMKRIDCFKQADKIWRLDIVVVILFKGIPLENTDSERLERVESCSNTLCVNPYHVLITCKELDLLISHYMRKSTTINGHFPTTNNDIVLASVHTMNELLDEESDVDVKDATENGIEGKRSVVSTFANPLLVHQEITNNNPEIPQDLVETVTQKRQTVPVSFEQMILPNFEQGHSLFGKKLPQLHVTLQPQSSKEQTLANRADAGSKKDVQPSSRPPAPEIEALPKDDESLQRHHPLVSKKVEGIKPNPNSQLTIKSSNNQTLQDSNELQGGNLESQRNVLQPTYRHVQVFNPTHVATGMYFPFSNERTNFSHINAPSSLASTLTSILPPSSYLTLPGPLFVLQPITSEAVFVPPNSGTSLSLTPFVASSPMPKLQHTVANIEHYSAEQLGFQNFIQLSSRESLTSSSASSFNLEQFIDFGQQSQSSFSMPSSSQSQVAIATSSSPKQALTTSVSGSQLEMSSNKRSRKLREIPSNTNKIKKQRRASVTSHFDEMPSSYPIFSSEPYIFGENALKVLSSENFSRTDRQEGFKFFQSLGTKTSTSNKLDTFESFDVASKVQKSVFSQEQLHNLPQESKGDSPSSDGESPMLLPQIFTKELFSPTRNVPKPIAIFNIDNNLARFALTSNNASSANVAKDGDGENVAGARLGSAVDSDDDREDDKDPSLAFNGNRTLQMMVGYQSSMVTESNNSNPVMCCLNGGELLSPTPPFNPPSSPAITPTTTPCSTPIPRWCTPYFFEGESEAYLMVINAEEICFSNESSSTSSDRRSQTSSNPLPIGRRPPEDGAMEGSGGDI